MGPMMPPPPGKENKDNIPKPKSLREVPSYLKKVVTGFCSRLMYIYRLVWETRPWILFAELFIAVFNGVIPVIGAYVTKLLLNILVEAYNQTAEFEAVMTLLLVQFAVIFVRSIMGIVNSTVSRIAGELVVQHIKIKIITKAKDIDLASFDLPQFYEKLENANREAGGRPIQILNSTFTVMSTVISMITFVAVLWAVSPAAPFIIILLSIPSAVINFRYRRKNVNYMRRRSKDRRKMDYFSSLMVNKDLAKEVRMFDLSDTFIGKFIEVFKGYFSGLKKLIMCESWWHAGIAVVSTVVNCLLFLLIAFKVSKGELMIGDYSLCTNALTSIAAGVSTLISTTATVYEGTLFIDNMISFMNEKKTVVPSIEPARHVKRGSAHLVEFRNVSFRYPGTERNVLENINISFGGGDTVVLVGLNGAGKTTLIKLLTRLYDPTEGTIYLDGEDIKSYSVEELYDIFGMIFQDFGKYAVSVSENIAYGQIKSPVDSEKIRQAAVKSGADSFIEKLPSGYDTPLMRFFEENATELSIGQWQKLAIARAFYGDSDIVILDEPTASLDALAEQEIYRQFDELRKDKTTVFVSHRLSSATTATKIIVLENGKVVETGTHSELMQANGHYSKLFTAQASRYVETNENILGYTAANRTEDERI